MDQPGRAKRIIIVLAFQVIAGTWLMAGNAMAEAWPRGEDNLFISLKAEYYETHSYWDRDGAKKDLDEPFRKLSLQPYIEYGLTDRDTMVCKVFYDWLDNGEDVNSGFSDMELGYRRLIADWDNYVFSLGVMGVIPLGYSLEDSPQLGYSRFGLEGTASLGRGWVAGGRNGYIELGLRYRYYFGYPSDQIRGFLTAGHDLNTFLQIILENELQWALHDTDSHVVDDQVSMDAFYRLWKTTLHLRIRISDSTSFVLSGFKHMWGQNTGAGGGGALSLWLEF